MARFEQTTAYGINPIQPTTAGRLARFTTTGNPAKATNALGFAEADSGHQILIGVGAVVNAGQTAGLPAVIVGEGCLAWGDGAICIGKNSTAGANAARDGVICIGSGASTDAKNAIRIGSALAFGVGAGDDAISIGTQASTGGNASIQIGRGASAQVDSVSIGYGANAAERWGVALGYQAACSNSGNSTGSKCVAIGYLASAMVTAPGDMSAIAIGRNASAQGRDSVAIGSGASVPYSSGTLTDGIAIGHGATVAVDKECVLGNGINGPINLLSIGGSVAVGIRNQGSALGIEIRNQGNTVVGFRVDESATAADTRALVYDVTAAVLKRISIGVADSGGAGYKLLRILN